MILLCIVLFFSISSSYCHNVVIEEISETFVDSPENVLTQDNIEQFVEKSLKDSLHYDWAMAQGNSEQGLKLSLLWHG